MFKAVLSTTVLPLDGVYKVETLRAGEVPSLEGVPHYIGHPDTKAIVESLGAVPAPTKLFEGLQPGEKAVCFPISPGKSSRAKDGFTSPHQEVESPTPAVLPGGQGRYKRRGRSLPASMLTSPLPACSPARCRPGMSRRLLTWQQTSAAGEKLRGRVNSEKDNN